MKKILFKNLRTACLILLTISGIFFIIASGGEDSGDDTTVSYTGVTDQAVISEDNARSLISGAETMSELSGITDFITDSDIRAEQSTETRLSGLLMITNEIKEYIEQQDWTAESQEASRAIAASDTQTCSGGGALVITGDTNLQNGTMSGTAEFNACVFGRMSISGSIEFTGTLDTTTSQVLTLTMGMGNISMTVGNFSVAGTGSISATYSDNISTVKLNVIIRDNNSGETYWAKDITVKTNITSNTQISVTGFFYDHYEGYVSIEATPEEGITISGALGPLGLPTQALLDLSLKIWIDADGDGEWDLDIEL